MGERAMRETTPSPEAFRASVLAVPPLARAADFGLSASANRALCDHLRAGGVSTFLWGGNANLYNMGVSEFALFLDMIEAITVPGDWHIPSLGPDFGKAMDQAEMLAGRGFSTAMALPMRFPATPEGVATGLSLLARRFGRPLIAYVKDDGYIRPTDLAALKRDGAICAVKYGTVRTNPADDAELAAIVEAVGAENVISGIGERPVIDHVRAFGLSAFTSGSVCIAPRLSMDILAALHRGDVAAASTIRAAFLPLEDLRDRHSPLRVLHEAVRLAGIAQTGPMQPMLSNLSDPGVLAPIETAAKALKALNAAALTRMAAE